MKECTGFNEEQNEPLKRRMHDIQYILFKKWIWQMLVTYTPYVNTIITTKVCAVHSFVLHIQTIIHHFRLALISQVTPLEVFIAFDHLLET